MKCSKEEITELSFLTERNVYTATSAYFAGYSRDLRAKKTVRNFLMRLSTLVKLGVIYVLKYSVYLGKI